MNRKRLYCCIFTLILVLIFSAFPVSADETSENNQNPSVSGAEAQYPESMLDAANILREGLKKRERFILVKVQLDADSFDGTKESAQTVSEQIKSLALAHTGVPTEGDYLRFETGYLEPEISISQNTNGWQITLNYQAAYYAAAEQEAQMQPAIDEMVASLQLKSDLPDYQKIWNIYDYLCSTVAYDYDTLEDDTYFLKFSAYATLINKTSVCQGYSTLFYRLALEAGIDARVVTGIALGASGGENHSWNIVKIDGQYYHLDATWDAQEHNFRWFLIASRNLLLHELDEEYKTEAFLTAHPQAKESYQHPSSAENNYEYQIFNGTAVIRRYTGSDANVIVPSMLGGYPVHTIASGAFSFNDAIVSLTFSEGIQMIESAAVSCCNNLKSINLPSTVDFTASKDPHTLCRVICGPYECPSVETITVAKENPNLAVVDGVLYSKDMTFLRYYPTGDTREVFEIPEGVAAIGADAFAYNQHIKEVIMPDTVLRLNMSCFANCTSLEKIRLSNNCYFIDQYNFSYTALESIHIPASVTTLYYGFFGYTDVLKTITVDPANPIYYAVDNVLYARYTEDTRPESSYIPGDWLIKYPSGSNAASFHVPDSIVGLDQGAFACASNLMEITLPDSLQVVFSEAFYGCEKLNGIQLPDQLKHIDNSVFGECYSLVEITIPASVEYLGYYLISHHNLEQIVFLGDAPELSDQTFMGNTINLYYPAGNTTWADAIQMYAHESGVQWIECCETHQFADASRDATCEGSGFIGQKCSVCGFLEITGELIPATGHDVANHIEPPTCETAGLTYDYCTICYTILSDSYPIAPLGHSYDADGNCINCTLKKPEPSITEPSITEPSITEPGADAEFQKMIFVLFFALIIVAVAAFVVICIFLLKEPKKANRENPAPTDPTAEE